MRGDLSPGTFTHHGTLHSRRSPARDVLLSVECHNVIAVIDIGIGNSGSVVNMARRLGFEAVATSDKNLISRASHLILPGVGAFDTGMTLLEEQSLEPLLRKRVLEEGIPFLGICLGMQMLTKRSQEGTRPGLGWIDAETIRFDPSRLDETQRIPHMGWNLVNHTRRDELFVPFDDEIRFYFLHSYHVVCFQEEDILGITNYGYDFVSAFQRDNIIGTQFHIEKSHVFGMKFLSSFLTGSSPC
jgi:glutamine amidotransferase